MHADGAAEGFSNSTLRACALGFLPTRHQSHGIGMAAYPHQILLEYDAAIDTSSHFVAVKIILIEFCPVDCLAGFSRADDLMALRAQFFRPIAERFAIEIG